MAKAKGMCEVCGSLPIWRLGGTGMCFPCTTGESDASDDNECVYTDSMPDVLIDSLEAYLLKYIRTDLKEKQ